MKLYNMHFKYDYSPVHSNTSVDAAVGSASAAVRFATFSLILVVLSKKPNNFLGFLPLCDNTQVRIITFIKDRRKKNTDYLYSQFSKYRKRV